MLHRFEYAQQFLLTDTPVSENRRMLIGGYFTQEYALESAALFNPSMVWHPDQVRRRRKVRSDSSSVCAPPAKGTCRRSHFDRARSTISATSRSIRRRGSLRRPIWWRTRVYEKPLFQRKLVELGFANGFVEHVMGQLPHEFTFEQLQNAVATVRRELRLRAAEFDIVANAILALGKSNYEFTFSPEQSLAERAIFPYSPSQTNGIEDSRFVQFHEDDGTVRYYATHTAFDGRVTLARAVGNIRLLAISHQYAQRARGSQQRPGAISRAK